VGIELAEDLVADLRGALDRLTPACGRRLVVTAPATL
jgi:hypothetical protein